MDLTPPVFDGQVDQAYANPRDEVTVLVPSSAHRILDVGSSAGVMGEALVARGCDVTGIEYSHHLAELARPRLTTLFEGDVEQLAAEGFDPGAPFDCVVMADVLEHLRDPWTVVRWAAGLVGEGGSMVISLPNVRHLHLVYSLLLRRRWPYREVGVFDRTHLRWFAYENLPLLLDGTGFEISELTRNYMLREWPTRADRFAPLLRDFGTLQFIFRAERRIAS